MFLFLSVLALWNTLVWAAPQAQDAILVTPVFRSDYTYERRTNSFYKEHTIKDNWNEAVWTCQAEGAMLAAPTTKLDVTVLTEFFSRDTADVWLALHDKFSEGDFVTLYGTPIADIYTNWSPGEPNDSGGDEDCVVLNKAGTYNDVRCHGKVRYICVKPNDEPITLSMDCQTYDKEYVYNQQTNACYKFHSKPRNWHEATRICRSEQASLGEINSDSEADIYMAQFQDFPESALRGTFNKTHIHLDFSDLVIPGVFANIRNQPLDRTGYIEWAENQPAVGGTEHCGSMNRDGKLSVFNCTDKAMFICEMKLPGKMKNNKG